jgi:ribosome-binding protein aMBF1 (putative translation factor)
MNIKEYFWDLSETALEEAEQIVRNPAHPSFVKRIIRVLSRCDQPKEIFTLITKKQFTENWPKIRREWKRTNEAAEHFSWWESVYEQLLKQENSENKRVKGAPAKENQEIGRKIRQAREQKGWSQTDLAHHTGLKQPDISAIEKGKKNITLATLSKLEKILELRNLPESANKKEAEMPEGPQQNFRLDGIQKQVYESLKELAGPGAEVFYRDACWLRQNGENLQSRSHPIGHYFREIESSVRDVLGICLKIKNTRGGSSFAREIEERVGKLRGIIKQGDKREIEKNAEQLATFVKGAKPNTHKREIEEILKELGVAQDDLYAQTWLRLADHKTLPMMAHRVGLSRPREYSEDMQYEFLKFDGFLNWALGEIRKHSSDFIKILDELLGKENPIATDVEILCGKIPNTFYIRNYFFGKCTNPKWLALLKDKGAFQYPPAPQQNEEGYIRFAVWAESGYLVRMATEAPREVADIILLIPDTQNVYVIDDLVKATLNMPIEIALTVMEKAAKWMANEYMFYPLDGHLGELIRYYISAGKADEALELTKILLDILPDPNWQEKSENGDFQWDGPHPKARIDNYSYKKLAGNTIPELAKSTGVPVFQWLCGMLDRSLTYSRAKDTSPKNNYDYSSYWRPEIEKPTQYEAYELKNILIDLILKTGMQLEATIGINIVVSILNEKSWVVFKRIALYLLSKLDQALPEALKPYYEKLVQEYSEAEKTLGYELEVMEGWESGPKNNDELAVLPVEKLVQYLNEWKLSVETRGVSAEGLAQTLYSLVKVRPELYSAEAQQFTQLTSTYTSIYLFWIFWGFEEVLRNANPKLEWIRILELCQWMIKQSREIKKINAAGWSQAGGGIANLLGEGMRKNLIPLKLRKNVWVVLEPLTEDPDPTSEYEKTNRKEPYSLSINSTRGKAMHAVMKYALWVYRNRVEGQAVDAEEGKNQEILPEIEAVLEKHLDHTQDSTLAIHSVYGQWFPCLAKVKPEWAARNRVRIFPSDESDRKYWEAAWEAYILFCHPYNDVFEILKTEYNRAIEEIESVTEKKGERLVWHLMLFYIWGRLEQESDIFINFWKRASDELRAEAIFYIGFNILTDAEKQLPDKEMQRIIALWENRRETVLSAPIPMAYIKEMAAFGHWFGSGKLEPQWAIHQLLFVLETTKRVDAIPPVMEQLETMAANFPREVVKILKALAENERDFMAFNQYDIEVIIENVLCGHDDEGRTKAREFCDYLISKGIFKFKNLLQMCEEQSLGK